MNLRDVQVAAVATMDASDAAPPANRLHGQDPEVSR